MGRRLDADGWRSHGSVAGTEPSLLGVRISHAEVETPKFVGVRLLLASPTLTSRTVLSLTMVSLTVLSLTLHSRTLFSCTLHSVDGNRRPLAFHSDQVKLYGGHDACGGVQTSTSCPLQ